jgi:heat shock protein HslJ
MQSRLSTPRTRIVGITCSAVLALSACGSDDAPEVADAAATTAPAGSAAASVPAASLEGSTWTLVGGALDAPIGEVAVTARFEEGTVLGTSGCNSYTTTYELDGASLTIAPEIAGTQRACPDAETAVEVAYLEALPTVASYAIEGSTLSLIDADGSSLLDFEVTDAAQAILGDWTVTSFYTGDAVSSPVGDVTLTATFGPSTVTGDAGCNTFNGAYTLDGESIEIGPLASTRVACPTEELQQQEDAYLAALQLATSYEITGDRLDLFRPGRTYAATLERG